ncbi:MAG: hypothetical protein L0332_23715 [Chloroflexi bacterium]|nr:hypothetical protein [Chloroflexota bacterium]MCI0577208.1 hypothetical protein [Chloroflexota bacterium]MCI0649082.1 hypothetical protein [Chloroflexota bacterium]MCI0729701.1 hypothetical protein [Chloroflexota bacterium]
MKKGVEKVELPDRGLGSTIAVGRPETYVGVNRRGLPAVLNMAAVETGGRG